MELLFDDEWVDVRAGVRRVLGAVRKEPEPVLKPEAPWEEQVQGHRAVLFDQEERKFKLWYRASVAAPEKAGGDDDTVSSERARAGQRTFLCYAESADGLVWTRPSLDLFTFQGSRDNNILREMDHGDSVWWNVLKDPADPDPARRYKALGFQGRWESSTIEGVAPGRKGVGVAYSPDGIHWPDPPHMVMDTADVTDADCILPRREPTTGKWVAFFRPRTHPKRRYIGYAESDDFDHWTYPRMLLTPDAGDPEWYEFYGLTVGCLGRWRVGGLWVYHNNPESSPMTTELVYSRDGINYRRALPGEQFVPLGPAGSFDSRMVSPLALIERGAECLIYYNGRNCDHGSDRGMDMQPSRCPEGEAPMGGIGLARVPGRNFCGLRADMDGRVESKWLCNYGRAGVTALADVAQDGWIHAEILDPYGDVIPGWDRAACRAQKRPQGSFVRSTLRAYRQETPGVFTGRVTFSWGGEELVGACGQQSAAGGQVGHVVKLRFHLHRATLYGFGVGEERASPPYVSE